MKNLIGVTKDIQVVIEGRLQTVMLSIEFYAHLQKYYHVSAICENGYDLCNFSYGYLQYSVPVTNTRLRSELSIASAMADVLDGFETALHGIANEIILTERTAIARISGTDVFTNISAVRFFNAACIKSKQSGQCISWYEHDVFKQGEIELTVSRGSDGRFEITADEKALYDFDKLRTLRNSDRFKDSKLAFFFYNEVRRLLGETVTGDPERMSGLFHQGIQE